MIDPRTPVIVGVGQVSERAADPATANEPMRLIERAVELALADSGRPALRRTIDTIGVVKGLWPGRAAPASLAVTLGVPDARCLLSTDGGDSPQRMLGHFAGQIRDGALDAALITGAEALWSSQQRRRLGLGKREHTRLRGDVPAAATFGSDEPLWTGVEEQLGISVPTHAYALFEVALRHHLGAEGHEERLGRLWADFSAVAETNPHAWARQRLDPADITKPTADNRLIAYPYTKAMCANIRVDQAAAVLLVAAATASALGVPRDQWIFPQAVACAQDTAFVSHRENLYSSPAIRNAWRRLREHTGLGVDELPHVDVYSCFPSAVQIAAREIGLDPARPLTVTGGLAFAGGPGNNYVTHAIAALTDRLRAHPGEPGLCTANGGFLTKHALGVYSSTPPEDGFAMLTEPASAPARAAADSHTGAATIESYTVRYGREDRHEALLAVLLADGRRAWARSENADFITVLATTDAVGEPVEVDGHTLVGTGVGAR